MDQRLLFSKGCVVRHGRAPYRASRGSPRLVPIALTTLLLLLGAVRPAVARPAPLKATGTPRHYHVKVAGGKQTFRFAAVSGCRYRLVAEHGTLTRPILELGRAGEEPFERVDAGEHGKDAVHVWRAERDAMMEAHVSGFSALTGRGKIRLETLGPDGKRVRANRRFLGITGERAPVGELLLGEVNRWELVVEEGRAYQITPTQGSAGRVRLRVLGWHGEVLADSTTSAMAWLAHAPVRFRAPPRPAAEASPGEGNDAPNRARAEALILEVRGLFDGGGTYGLRMKFLGENQSVDPPATEPPAEVERGPLEGVRNAFRAGPGDLAVLYVPLSPNRTQTVQVKRGDRWVRMEDIGMGGSARSQENALLVWFQPYYPGTYRFAAVPFPPPSEPQLLLLERSTFGGAPIHMGTGMDPTVRARLGSKWKLVALGVCMPGWDYIFVCVHGPEQGIAMRVKDGAGKTIRNRSASARTISPGLGPSMRFRVSKPGVYRLEAKNARKRVIRPLMRRASN